MFLLPIMGEHQYTLAATGLKIGSYTFDSREKARRVMYEIIDKNNLHVIKKYTSTTSMWSTANSAPSSTTTCVVAGIATLAATSSLFAPAFKN